MKKLAGRGQAALIALGLTIGLLGCSAPDAPAATVNGEPIPAAAVQQDLDDVAQNTAYLEARTQQGLPFRGAEPGTYDTAVVADILDRKVMALIVHQELARRRLGPVQTAVDQARDELRRQVVDPNSGAPLMDGFPGRYVDQQARLQAESDVLQAAEGNLSLDDAALQAEYMANTAPFQVWCVRWIVALSTGPEAIDRSAAAIAGGEDFAEVARRESADSQSAERGGDLGCQPAEGLAQYGDRFREVATTLAPGQTSDPTTADYGKFMVQVTDVKVRPFDEVRDAVRSQVLARTADPYEQLLRRLRRDAQVAVAPRFGTWDRTTPDSIRLLPPGGPTTAASPAAPAGGPTSLPFTGFPGSPSSPSP